MATFEERLKEFTEHAQKLQTSSSQVIRAGCTKKRETVDEIRRNATMVTFSVCCALEFSVKSCLAFQLEEAAPHVVRAAQLLLKFSSNQLASSHFNSLLDEWNTHAQNLAGLVQDSLDPVAFIKALGDVLMLFASQT